MGSAHSLFSDPQQDAALAQLASRLGPQPIDRVAQAAALVRVMPYFDDLGGEGVALPGVDPADVATIRPLTDLVDTLACDKLPVPREAPAPSSRSLKVEFLTRDRPNYSLAVTRGRGAVNDDTWQASTWAFASPLELKDVQSAYLLLVGVVPQKSLLDMVPWGLVPGFVDTAQMLQEGTSLKSDPIHIKLPANVAVLALTHALLQGATLVLDE
jgi:hypothetical protein